MAMRKGPVEIPVNTPPRKRTEKVSRPTASARLSVSSAVPATPAGKAASNPPTPRFSTTFKTFQNKNYDAIHKTRCPCLDIPKLEREIAALEEKGDDTGRLKDLKAELQELRDHGCKKHGKILTREEINQLQQVVASHTPHGLAKQRKEMFATAVAEGRSIAAQEDAERKELQQQEAEHMAQLLRFFAERGGVEEEEEKERAAIEEEEEEAPLASAHHDGMLEATVAEEGRVRRETEEEWEGMADGVARAKAVDMEGVRIMMDERDARRRLEGEEEESLWETRRRALEGQLRVVELLEEAHRGAILRGEDQRYATLAADELCQRGTAAVEAEEAVERRAIQADEVYTMEEMWAESQGSCAGVVVHCEEVERRRFVEMCVAEWDDMVKAESLQRALLQLADAEGIRRDEIVAAEAGASADLLAEYRSAELHIVEGIESDARAQLMSDEEEARGALEESMLHEGGELILFEHEASSRAAIVHEASAAIRRLVEAEEDDVRGALCRAEGTERGEVGTEMVATLRVLHLEASESAGRREVVLSEEGAAHDCLAAHEAALRELLVDDESASRSSHLSAAAVEGGELILNLAECHGRQAVCDGFTRGLLGATCDMEGTWRRCYEREEDLQWRANILYRSAKSRERAELFDKASEEMDLVLSEQEAEWEAICRESDAERQVLFVCVDDFLIAKEHFNNKETIQNLGVWEVPVERHYRCAANEDLMSLLRHSNTLYMRLLEQWQETKEAMERELLAERSKKQSLAAELSRLKEDHAALDKSHRQLVSDHAKLEKAHVASKTRLESIEKERRCTSSANEKAVLEKRLRAAEDEAAKLKALYEKEKSRSLSAARKPAPKKA